MDVTTQARPPRPRPVQIVESSRPLAEALARECRGRGVDVEIFASVGRALAAACDRKPVAILCGMHLPGLPGTSLVAALKCAPDYRAVPIALVTSDAGSIAAARGGLADVVIPKTRDLREAAAAFLDSVGLPRGAEPEATAAPASRGLEGRRILVAEDAAVLQKLVRHVLHVAGADVVVVENGEEAIETAKRAPFDLVLMDVEMPVLDGCRATRRMRSLGLALPILALTGHASAEFRARALMDGFDDVLAKPVPKRVLLEACDRALSRSCGESTGS